MVGVRTGPYAVSKVRKHYLFKTLHDYRCEGYRFVVIKAVYSRFVGMGMTPFPPGISQGEVEQPGDDPLPVGPRSPWDAVWASSSPGVHHSQSPLNLMFLEGQGCVPGAGEKEGRSVGEGSSQTGQRRC